MNYPGLHTNLVTSLENKWLDNSLWTQIALNLNQRLLNELTRFFGEPFDVQIDDSIRIPINDQLYVNP